MQMDLKAVSRLVYHFFIWRSSNSSSCNDNKTTQLSHANWHCFFLIFCHFPISFKISIELKLDNLICLGKELRRWGRVGRARQSIYEHLVGFHVDEKGSPTLSGLTYHHTYGREYITSVCVRVWHKMKRVLWYACGDSYLIDSFASRNVSAKWVLLPLLLFRSLDDNIVCQSENTMRFV